MENEIKMLDPQHGESSRVRKIRILAKTTLEKDGELEIDDNAVISESDDNGAYVQAWVWIDFDGTQFDKNRNSK